MDCAVLPTSGVIHRTVEAVQARGIHAELVETKEEALAKLQAIIPLESVAMTGGSITLQRIGFEAILISGQHPLAEFPAGFACQKRSCETIYRETPRVLAVFFSERLPYYRSEMHFL